MSEQQDDKDIEITPGPSGIYNTSFFNLSEYDEDDISSEVAAEIDALRLEEIEIKQITAHCKELEERIDKKEDEVVYLYEKNKQDQEKEELLKKLIKQTNKTISAKRETLVVQQQLYDQHLQKNQQYKKRQDEALADYDAAYNRIKAKYDQLPMAIQHRKMLAELSFVEIKYNEMCWRVKEQEQKNKQIREIRFKAFQKDVIKFAEVYVRYSKMLEKKKVVEELEKKFGLSDDNDNCFDIKVTHSNDSNKNLDVDKSSEEDENKMEYELNSDNYETNITIDKSKIEFPSPAIDMKALELPPLTPMSSIDMQMDDIPKPVLGMNIIDSYNYLPSKKQDMVQKYYETSSLASVSNETYKKLITSDVLAGMKEKIQTKQILKKNTELDTNKRQTVHDIPGPSAATFKKINQDVDLSVFKKMNLMDAYKKETIQHQEHNKNTSNESHPISINTHESGVTKKLPEILKQSDVSSADIFKKLPEEFTTQSYKDDMLYLKDYNCKFFPKKHLGYSLKRSDKISNKRDLLSVSFDDTLRYHPEDIPLKEKPKKFKGTLENLRENKENLGTINEENIESERNLKRKTDSEKYDVKHFKQVTFHENNENIEKVKTIYENNERIKNLRYITSNDFENDEFCIPKIKRVDDEILKNQNLEEFKKKQIDDKKHQNLEEIEMKSDDETTKLRDETKINEETCNIRHQKSDELINKQIDSNIQNIQRHNSQELIKKSTNIGNIETFTKDDLIMGKIKSNYFDSFSTTFEETFTNQENVSINSKSTINMDSNKNFEFIVPVKANSFRQNQPSFLSDIESTKESGTLSTNLTAMEITQLTDMGTTQDTNNEYAVDLISGICSPTSDLSNKFPSPTGNNDFNFLDDEKHDDENSKFLMKKNESPVSKPFKLF